MTGISILDGIGSTEVLHIFVSNRHDDIRPGTSGKPVPGYEVKIVDKDGYYVNAGRGDDMLKVGGMWCSPLEIEARLIAHPKVREVAVIGMDDEEGLNKPAAYVVLKKPGDAGEATADELKQYCKKGLAGYMYPRWIFFIEELPKTVTGKIQRFRLRQAEGQQDALPSGSQ